MFPEWVGWEQMGTEWEHRNLCKTNLYIICSHVPMFVSECLTGARSPDESEGRGEWICSASSPTKTWEHGNKCHNIKPCAKLRCSHPVPRAGNDRIEWEQQPRWPILFHPFRPVA